MPSRLLAGFVRRWRGAGVRLTRLGLGFAMVAGLAVGVALASGNTSVAVAPFAAAAGVLGGSSLYAGLAAGALAGIRVEAGEAATLEGGLASLRFVIRGGAGSLPLRLRAYTGLGVLEARGWLRRERSVVTISTKVPYGAWRVVYLHVCSGDPLGVYEACVKLPGRGVLLGLPRPVVSEARLAALASSLATGLAAGRPSRSGTVFFGLREYTSDDDARLIDWRSYARTGKLYVKEFEAEATPSPLVILDATPTLAALEGGEPAAAPLARTALGLALLLSKLGRPPKVCTVTPRGRVLQTAMPREYRRVLALVDPLEARGASCSERLPLLKRLLTSSRLAVVFTDACLSTRVAADYASLVAGLHARGVKVVLAYTGSRLKTFRERVEPVLAKTTAVYAGPPAEALRVITHWFASHYML